MSRKMKWAAEPVWISALVMVLGGTVETVWAESVLEYSIGLQSAECGPYSDYVESYPELNYPTGTQEDDRFIRPGESLTWDASIEVSGIQEQGDGAGMPVMGAAHLAFDLELRHDSPDGPVVAEDVFYSEIKPDESVAFPLSMNLGGFGPGRAIDNVLSGGPNMADHAYPVPVGGGILKGLHLGYADWQGGTGPETATFSGVGLVAGPSPEVYPFPTGRVAVVEGQLDTRFLPWGRYCLICKLREVNTVLRGDINLQLPQTDVATAADMVVGDCLCFSLAWPELVLLSAASRRYHANQPFDLPIPLDGTSAIEPRQNATSPRLVLTFDRPPSPLSCADLTVVNGVCHAVATWDSEVVVDMSYDRNACVEISFLDKTLKVITLEGDTIGDGNVNILDMQYCKLRLFEIPEPWDFVCDINTDGMENILDMQAIKLNLFQTQSCVTTAAR